MIKKLEPLQGLDHSWLNKINELVDAVNELQEFADVADKNLATLMEENNIHEKQIDELQMKVEPEKCKTPAENLQELAKKAEKECRFNPVQADREVYKALTSAENAQDKFAEQRKWQYKLCWFWDDGCADYIGILYGIHDLDEIPFENDLGEKYQHCRPVKPDDDIIYKGE